MSLCISQYCSKLSVLELLLLQIEEYLEQIIDMIVVQFFQPYDVCAYLKLCP